MSRSLPPQSVRAALDEAVRGGFPAAVADLSRLVRIPSVAWAGFDHTHVHASAEAIAELFRDTGVFDDVRIERAKLEGSDELGQPAVLATRKARNGAPTVLLYAHHDVQPPGKDEDWRTPPFEPTLVTTADGERLYGRGTADDKAGVVSHLASIRAIKEVLGDDFDLGLSVFIEGEEEAGSLSFGNFIVDHADVLRADAIVVADSDNWNSSTPAITVGLRGNVAFQLRITTLDHASHSGMFGGAVPDAMLAATTLLATLWDEDGAVAVDGLRSRVADTPEYPESQLRAEAGLPDGVSPIGRGPILDRIWNQPSVTVTGIDAPSIQNASNTLIPSVTVKISARIAPGQSPQEAFAAIKAHLEANSPFGAKLEFSHFELGAPFLVDTSAPLFGLAKDAMTGGWGVEALETGIGGSIPFIAQLVEVFPQAQILITGVEDPDTRAHSPNESLHLGVFRKAILSQALFLTALSGRE